MNWSFLIGLLLTPFIYLVAQSDISTHSFFFDPSREIKQNNVFEIQQSTIDDVVAVSFVVEGKGVSNKTIFPVIHTPLRKIEIPAFHEDSYHEDKFISDLVYMTPQDAGKCAVQVNSDPSIKSQISINVRVFTSTKVDVKVDQNLTTGARNMDCDCPKPLHIARTSWGLAFGLDGDIFTAPPTYTEVTHLIVHHSAGTNVSNNWPAVVASIFDLHVNTNGWQDIGYNWLIDPNGVIYEGRGGGENVQGAHMCGYNANTMGVCVLGNFVTASPSSKSLESLKRLLAWKSCLESIAPKESSNINSYPGFMMHISGHKDGCGPNFTACPGQILHSKLDSIRNITLLETEACEISSSFNENILTPNIDIYPSPAHDQIKVDCSFVDQDLRVNIINSLGKLVYTRQLTGDWIELSHLNAGIYLVQVSNGYWSATKRIFKL